MAGRLLLFFLALLIALGDAGARTSKRSYPPGVKDPLGDPDGDTLTNRQESFLGTNPNSADTDGDQIRDDDDPYPLVRGESAPYLWGTPQVADDHALVQLSWTMQGEGISVNGFIVERRIGTSPWAIVGTLGSGEREWSEELRLAGENVYYRVRAWAMRSGEKIFLTPSRVFIYQLPLIDGLFVSTSGLDGRTKGQWSFKQFENTTNPPLVPQYYLVRTVNYALTNSNDLTKTHLWWWPWQWPPVRGYTNRFESVETMVPSERSYTGFSSNWSSWSGDGHDPNNLGDWEFFGSSSSWSTSFIRQRDKDNHVGVTDTMSGSTDTSHYDDDESGPSGGTSISGGSSQIVGSYVAETGTNWQGDDFNLAFGKIVFSGTSAWTNPLASGWGEITGTLQSAGQWSGTNFSHWTDENGSHSTTNSMPNSPEEGKATPSTFVPFWGTSWDVGVKQLTPTLSVYSTPVNEAMLEVGCVGNDEGTAVLAGEYSTEAFVKDVRDDLPDWPAWQRSPSINAVLAYEGLAPSQDLYSVRRAQYHFKTRPTSPRQLRCSLVFTPDDAPETPQDESLVPRAVESFTWSAPQQGGTIPVRVIDPINQTNGYGNYRLFMSPELLGDMLDFREKVDTGVTFQPVGTSYESTFRLNPVEAHGSEHAFTWAGQGISLWIQREVNGEPVEEQIHYGQSLEQDQWNPNTDVFIIRADPSQMSTAFAGITVSARDHAGNSMGSDTLNAKFLPSLIVDGNRDGVMSFTDPAVRAADATGANGKFRFWVNDDDDRDNEDHPDSSQSDNADNQIQSMRDLEDFARPWINVGGIHEGLLDGTFKVGLKWKDTGALKPAIKIYRAAEANGGDGYVKDQEIADDQVLGSAGTALGTVADGSAFIFPASFWQASWGVPAISGTQPNRPLLFEGSAEGKGQLVVTLHKSDGTEIGEGPGVWLDITDIRKMYEKAIALPIGLILPFERAENFDEAGFASTAASFQKPPDETQQCIMLVHGWLATDQSAEANSETMFKRLWHRGFKGRFSSFRWPTETTYSPESFHNSEWLAYKYSRGLKFYCDDLRSRLANYSISVAVHSLGSAVLAGALARGVDIDNAILMQGAISAHVFDSEAPLRVNPLWPVPEGSFSTPDWAADGGYRGWLTSSSVNICNFYNTGDSALFGWKLYENGKPHDPTGTGSYQYNSSSGQRRIVYSSGSLPTRDVWDQHESMAYVAISRTEAVGAFASTAGQINQGGFNLGSGGLSYGIEHSPQFERSFQNNLLSFYNEVLLQSDVTPNP